jgi:hypothetical protein
VSIFVSPTVIRLVGSWAVPLVVLGAYAFLVYTIDPPMTAALITFVVFLIVICIWFMFRELTAHAAIARAIAVGEPDDVVTRARNAIDHRLRARAKLPFRIYEAIGLGLRGQWAESIATIDEVAVDGLKRSWQLAAAAARVAAATELGDAAAARAAFAKVTALAPPTDMVRRECEARLAYVEGDRARAKPLFAALSSDIRLGPSARAAALYYAGRCEDDPAAARTLFERAIGLAPKTWIKAAAGDKLR